MASLGQMGEDEYSQACPHWKEVSYEGWQHVEGKVETAESRESARMHDND